MFKKLLNAIVNPISVEITKKNQAPANENSETVVRPYTPQDNEEITRLLTNFDNVSLMNHIITLEKVVVNLSSKIEIQSGVIVKQSEILRDMHASLEEILFLFEAAASKPMPLTAGNEDNVIEHSKKTDLN